MGLAVDLLHLVRSGGAPDDIAAIPQELIFYAQFCDSNDLSANQDYATEAGSHRLTPGEGKLPIQEFIQALPKNIPIEIEVPQPPNGSAAKRINDIIEASKQQLLLATANE